jgi:glycosyltransferase involved in cell wall biosynthesis
MVAQTLLPERWIIVNDGSTDKTADIAADFARRFPWIELVHRSPRLDRHFGAKVHAFNADLEYVQSLPFEVIGNLDADLSFEPDYIEFLIRKFAEDPRLGVAGTPFTEDDGYDSARDSFEGENHVAGGCQLFRRRCFEDIGGYIPNPAGGIDWVAVTTARIKGWRTRSFPQKRFHYYRPLGTAGRSGVAASFSYGERIIIWAVHLCGSCVAWLIGRQNSRLSAWRCSWVTAGGAIRRVKRPITRDLMRFHRREQMNKLKLIFRSLLRFKKIDNFSLVTERQQ